jgi:phage tail-like protein
MAAAVTIGDVQDKFLVASWFHIEIDKPKNTITGVTDISGLNIEIDTVDVAYNMVAGQRVLKKRPAAVKYGELTIKRPMSAERSLYEWIDKIRNGDAAYRTNGAIVMYNITNAEVGRWTFQNAWPSKWSASDLDVGSNDPMVEELTVVIELLTRTK